MAVEPGQAEDKSRNSRKDDGQQNANGTKRFWLT